MRAYYFTAIVTAFPVYIPYWEAGAITHPSFTLPTIYVFYNLSSTSVSITHKRCLMQNCIRQVMNNTLYVASQIPVLT